MAARGNAYGAKYWEGGLTKEEMIKDKEDIKEVTKFITNKYVKKLWVSKKKKKSETKFVDISNQNDFTKTEINYDSPSISKEINLASFDDEFFEEKKKKKHSKTKSFDYKNERKNQVSLLDDSYN
jgi:hypothetical protein